MAWPWAPWGEGGREESFGNGRFLSERTPPPPLQALANSTVEYESLESEVSALHDDLWEQLNLDVQVKRAPGQEGVSVPSLLLWAKRDQSGFLSCF